MDNLPAYAVSLGCEFLLTDTKILGTLMETLHLETLLYNDSNILTRHGAGRTTKLQEYFKMLFLSSN